MKRMMLLVTLGVSLLLAGCGSAATTSAPTTEISATMTQTDAKVFVRFEDEREDLREKYKIPGYSAAIVRNQELVWAKGFGYADLENKVEATPDTPYHLASVTKPIAATLIMQLVEEGMLDLDEPVSSYGVDIESPGVVTVRHLLTHTSEGIPGSNYSYNGNRYALLGGVIEGATGKSFGQLLTQRVLTPLEMTRAALNPISRWGPGQSVGQGWESFRATIGLDYTRNFPGVYRELAHPYQLDSSYSVVPGRYEQHYNPAAGLMSTVIDLAKFDIALDQNVLVSEETKAQMFTPAASNAGVELPYGLGWFSHRYQGTRLIWHYGQWPPSVSALYLKMPDKNLTFIILANTPNLSTPHPMGFDLLEGDILLSTVALVFYQTFIFPGQYGETVPDIDWEAGEGDLVDQLQQVTDGDVREILERELWSYRQLFASVGRTELVDRLLDVHGQVYGSTRMRSQWQFTYLSSAVPEPEPPRVSVYDLVFVGRVWLAWLLLTGVSLAILVWGLARSRGARWGMRLAWLLVTVLFGPLGLLAYLLSYRRLGQQASNWWHALGASMYSVTGNAVGLMLVMTFFYLFLPAGEAGPVILVPPLLVGWLIFRAPLVAARLGGRYWVAVRRTLLTEFISTILVLVGMLPVLIILQDRFFTPNLNSPLFWGFISLGAIVGAVLLYPYNVWMVRRGSAAWPGQAADYVGCSIYRH